MAVPSLQEAEDSSAPGVCCLGPGKGHGRLPSSPGPQSPGACQAPGVVQLFLWVESSSQQQPSGLREAETQGPLLLRSKPN